MCAEKNGHVMLVRQIEEFEQGPTLIVRMTRNLGRVTGRKPRENLPAAQPFSNSLA